ncbi:MAG: TlpA disulfide reductase family protein [Acidimicrobiia bacterium]
MNKTILWIIGGVVGLGLIVALAFSIASEESLDESIAFGEITVEGANLPFLEDPSTDPTLGASAPTVSGGDWNDNQYSIAADGRPKIVIFLAHWCPHCQVEVPVVQDWINSGGLPSDVDMYSITVLSEKLRPNWPSQVWLEDEGWTVPVIMDDAQSSAVLAYGMRGTPFYVVLDGENTNLGRFSGEVGVAGLEAMVQLAQASN